MDDEGIRQAGLVPGVPGGGWRSRGYLPHRDERGLAQAITFRLADSLPRERLQALEVELVALPPEGREVERRKRIEAWLDRGLGCQALRHPLLAAVVEDGFLRGDGTRYWLLAWCVMPNHVHVLIRPAVSLATIVGSWKSFSGRWALAKNAELGLGVPGRSLWMREYWDRYMRDEHHLRQTVDYIHANPVKAGLCARAEDWRWSSARRLAGSAGHLAGGFSPSGLKAGLVPGAPGGHGGPGVSR